MPPVYSFALKVDGVDNATLKLRIASLPKNWSTPSISFPETTLPFVPGVVATSNVPKLAPMDYPIRGNIISANASGFETDVDALKYAYASGAGVALIPGNQPNRQRIGFLADMDIQPYPSLAEAKFEAVLRCRDPLWYATTNTTPSGAAATDIACALGTWTSLPVVTITFSGSAASTTLTYKTYGGATVGDPLVITHAFVNTDVLVVDMKLRTITLNGVRHDEYLSGGDFIELNPRDGVPSLAHWPTLRASAGAVAIAYPQRFL